MTASTIPQIVEQLRVLSDEKQREVLQSVRRLRASTEGAVAGQRLLRFAGAISQADLETMEQAIRDGCEQVDVRGC